MWLQGCESCSLTSALIKVKEGMHLCQCVCHILRRVHCSVPPR